jgi:hypothetical protein
MQTARDILLKIIFLAFFVLARGAIYSNLLLLLIVFNFIFSLLYSSLRPPRFCGDFFQRNKVTKKQSDKVTPYRFPASTRLRVYASTFYLFRAACSIKFDKKPKRPYTLMGAQAKLAGPVATKKKACLKKLPESHSERIPRSLLRGERATISMFSFHGDGRFSQLAAGFFNTQIPMEW